MNSRQRPIGVDLFAGAGGMTLGFEQAGFDVLAAVEIDPIHCATHEYNFPQWSVICKSAAEITGTEIRQLSHIGNREIDVVFGGSPCQGFSVIGKRALDDPRNSLVFHFLRLVLELQPKYFVFENVPGLTIGKHQQFILEIITEFQKNNYKVETNYQVLNAVNYGVPQDRTRLFILGCRDDLPLPTYPLSSTRPYIGKKSKYILNSPDLSFAPTVFQAIGDLPEIEEYPELITQDFVFAQYQEPSNYSAILRGMTTRENDYSYPRIYNPQILTSSIRTRHSQAARIRFENTQPGKTESISRFYRLTKDGICNTLRAGTPRNRGAFTSARPIHYQTARCISVREAARLHSYPDWFRFHITKWHGFRQVGNSVPPLLAEKVATEIIKVLNLTPSQPSQKIPLLKDNLLQFNMLQASQYYDVSEHVIEPRNRKKEKKLEPEDITFFPDL
ncbi:DNA cytosine methyltransferase [Calothrix sp. 336/3]|uniref:DNA cytosine methyltransferase n=1 Tax=Calothrix sp. 336/3 TaxID=1337936 RepID=UPI0004E395FF|nr:DNA cytosine methyltransferase [Calothrix sp. 336/3]